MSSGYLFKKADQEWEFEEISRLNYQTFVEEIPQHSQNSARRLEDQFHSENQYFVCLQEKSVVGMIAMRDRRPFSLEKKLGSLDPFFPERARLVETRLLSVVPGHRRGPIAMTLMSMGFRFFLKGGYDAIIISGTTRQLKMYKKIGFWPFGPLIGSEKALYQPMYITPDRLRQSAPQPLLEQIFNADLRPSKQDR
jgi:predicted N-acetyltransferase YhbS